MVERLHDGLTVGSPSARVRRRKRVWWATKFLC